MTFFEQDHSDGAHNLRVQCLSCKGMVRLSDAIIDREGPAFMAYYHRGCLDETPIVAKCDRPGCTKCR